jgi:hypothetical protein
MFVDQYGGGGVRHIKEASANANAESGDDALDIFANVNELRAA